MFPLDYVLAVALLGGSPEAEVPADAVSEFAAVRPALKALAVSWEVLDPRETRYILKQAESFPSDLKLLRKRYRDLADAPPLHDCMRFPDRALINDLLAFNRAYRQHLDSRQSLDTTRAYELNEALREADRLYHVWDTVRDARCEFYYVTVRRQALMKLRDMVGPKAYYSATLPPHVPVWRFTRID
jgi:hypothetical protein